MRFQKLSIASVTMLAVTTMASASFAEDTTTPSTSAGTGGSQSTTVMTPSSPSVPVTTSTTTTTQGSTSTSTPSTSLPPSSPSSPSSPTSTTTTTAGDMSATGIAPATPPNEARESVTLYRTQRPNRPLLITGGALLVGTYVTTAAFAGVNGPEGDKDLFLPVVGPWINIASRTCPRNDCSEFDRDTALIIGSGVLQGVGAALAISSVFVPEKIEAARITAGPVKMHIVPTTGRSSAGIGAVGTF
jgi:hypothetical protein